MDMAGDKLKPSSYPTEGGYVLISYSLHDERPSEARYTIFSRELPPEIQRLISFLRNIKNKQLPVK
jgi:hypothetical protein